MTGNIVGTPHYMSPEQVQGQSVDGRSDQFSLAVIAFEMLTGEKPFTGEHLTTVVFKIVAEEPVSLHRLNTTLGGQIESVMRKAMAKKPDARYATCQEFAAALEQACGASRNWKTMPRGGSLNAPTAMEVPLPSISIPPARRRMDATGTGERAAPRKSSFLTFLLAILVAAALLALIGWQAAPWLNPGAPQKTAKKLEPPKTAAPQQAQPASARVPAQPPPPGASQAAASGETKPSPLAAPEANKAPEEAAEKTPPPPRHAPTGPQAVTIISSPGGATVAMDGRSETSCTTPCSIDAPPGRHTVALTLPGYHTERREVDVGSGPVEMPAVILRAAAGTLMLTTVPSGASVLVDGSPFPQVTPVQISLSPGKHAITVEKDGKQISQTVEVTGGISYLKIPIGR
jgi:serine/threonine-protein kinase